MSTKIRISSNFGNNLLLETTTEFIPIPRKGESIEIEGKEEYYGEVTSVEYYISTAGVEENCIYINIKPFSQSVR